MFHLTPEMLKLLLILGKAEAWPAFLREFQKIRDDNVEQALHFNPEPDDANARIRQDLFRGIAVCLDVLYHSFSDPGVLLEEIQLIERTEKAKQAAENTDLNDSTF